MLEIKTIAMQMKNIFDGIISSLGVVEERISELDDISIENTNEKQRE